MEPEKDIFEQWDDESIKRPWIIRKLDSISLWWNQDGKYLHKEAWTGIKNIWYWLPIIWKDRNWDSNYIFEIMIHKLKAQSKYIGSRGYHMRAERDSEIMMTCVRLMKLVQEETYSSEYSSYHKTKHWLEDVEGNPEVSSWESKIIEENFDDYFKRYPLIYKRVLNGEGVFKRENREDNKQVIALNIAHINHDRARKLLFKIMEENIERWWD